MCGVRLYFYPARMGYVVCVCMRTRHMLRQNYCHLNDYYLDNADVMMIRNGVRACHVDFHFARRQTNRRKHNKIFVEHSR